MCLARMKYLPQEIKQKNQKKKKRSAFLSFIGRHMDFYMKTEDFGREVCDIFY